MKRIIAIGAALAMTLATADIALARQGRGEDKGRGKLQRQMNKVRKATARFHDVAAARAAGYIDPGPGHCVEAPGLGGMGIHFVNPRLVFDGRLDPSEPEILLYAPTKHGLRLVGVEYLMPTKLWTGDSAPNLFGTPFDGPMPEHEANTTGDHYDQHAWVWFHNPEGVLATWNPNLRC